MTYLEICQEVRILSGAQGTGPSSVEAGETGGYETNLVHFVDTVYRDIQNSKDDFHFLRAEALFNTVASQATYTSLVLPDDIKTINAMRVEVEGKWRYLEEATWDQAEYMFINNTNEEAPRIFASEPWSNDIKLYPDPDQAYAMHLDYQRKPEQLQLNEDTPMLPEEYHLLIVYVALERFAKFLGATNINEEYTKAAAIMYRKLYGTQVPAKTISRPRSFAI